jgi:MFS family permease
LETVTYAPSTADEGLPVPGGARHDGTTMTHRETMVALSGLLLGLFVAMLSATVVNNALPRILAELHGSSTSYTWVVTANLLAMTATTPIWGKLADLFNKRHLLQLALLIYVGGSALAGLSRTPSMLIACRVIQGVGVGGLSSLVQVAMAAMIPPRERGRYSGYIGATFAVATVAGPLIGGIIVDNPWLGWRWCFYLGLPVAAGASALIHRTLHLPVVARQIKIDYLGGVLIAGGVSVLLIWTSLAGTGFGWASTQTAGLVGVGVALLALAVLVEAKVAEPIVPLRLFRNRTIVLSIVASACTGTVMFASTVLFSPYFQLGRGRSPTTSGLLTAPLVGGLAVASLTTGRLITRTGRWKRFVVLGIVLIGTGLSLLGSTGQHTSLTLVAGFMTLVGAGLGMTQQNLIVAAQNTVGPDELGVVSSTVSFFRSLGGTSGVAALGAVLSRRVSDLTADGLAASHLPADALGDGHRIPNLHTLPAPVAHVVGHAYGEAVPYVFLTAMPLALAALLAVVGIRETRLRAGTDEMPPPRVHPAVPTRPARWSRPTRSTARPAAGIDGLAAPPTSGSAPLATPRRLPASTDRPGAP